MPTANPNTRELFDDLNALGASAGSARELMEGITKLLHQKMLRYNWVGFYMLEKEGTTDILVLGPFRGTMTPHTRIPLNAGICGAAASTGKTIIVDDVSSDARYLACSLELNPRSWSRFSLTRRWSESSILIATSSRRSPVTTAPCASMPPQFWAAGSKNTPETALILRLFSCSTQTPRL